MVIFSSFSVGFIPFCYSVVFALCVFSFRKPENFYVSTIQYLRQRGKNETKSKVNKIMRICLLHMRKSPSLDTEKISDNISDNNKLTNFIFHVWNDWDKLHRDAKFVKRVSLDEKTKSNFKIAERQNTLFFIRNQGHAQALKVTCIFKIFWAQSCLTVAQQFDQIKKILSVFQ